MQFLFEPEPVWGEAVQVAPGVRRIVARNPGPMTYHGTNTYLLEGPDGVSVLDPGPEDAAHLAAVLAAAGPVARILVSHGHVDHVAGLPALRAATGADVSAFSDAMAPDVRLVDGGEVAGWTVLHTPGHAPDHVCLARADGVVMSADHVMGWSTSVVSPPDGSMSAYFASLERLLARRDRVFLPGHGPAIGDPQAHVQGLLAHRIAREQAILSALAGGRQDVDGLVDALYAGLAPRLRPAASRNVAAHLIKLEAERRVRAEPPHWVLP